MIYVTVVAHVKNEDSTRMVKLFSNKFLLSKSTQGFTEKIFGDDDEIIYEPNLSERR